MAWDPNPGYHAAVTARRESDRPVAWYSIVTYYGPRRRFGRRKFKTVWRSDEVKVEGHLLSSEKNNDEQSRLLREAEDVAMNMEKDNPNGV